VELAWGVACTVVVSYWDIPAFEVASSIGNTEAIVTASQASNP